jgi:hypothetical protein
MCFYVKLDSLKTEYARKAVVGTDLLFRCLLNECLYLPETAAAPLQAWIGPEGSRKLRFPDILTTAQDGGKDVSLTHRPPLPPGNTPGTHFC